MHLHNQQVDTLSLLLLSALQDDSSLARQLTRIILNYRAAPGPTWYSMGVYTSQLAPTTTQHAMNNAQSEPKLPTCTCSPNRQHVRARAHSLRFSCSATAGCCCCCAAKTRTRTNTNFGRPTGNSNDHACAPAQRSDNRENHVDVDEGQLMCVVYARVGWVKSGRFGAAVVRSCCALDGSVMSHTAPSTDGVKLGGK